MILPLFGVHGDSIAGTILTHLYNQTKMELYNVVLWCFEIIDFKYIKKVFFFYLSSVFPWNSLLSFIFYFTLSFPFFLGCYLWFLVVCFFSSTFSIANLYWKWSFSLQHAYRDGRLEEVVLRHIGNEDGQTLIAKHIRFFYFPSQFSNFVYVLVTITNCWVFRLSDFLSELHLRWRVLVMKYRVSFLSADLLFSLYYWTLLFIFCFYCI